ncbi:MAG: sulfite exporter TauE/SafE family protein [Verrucomicrobiota bacterium]|nr:sulfite exporter TauE/SafE family protein [Verrucomicrobiota bacterium]
MDLYAALVLGLVGGLHCAGMCGPLALALPGRDRSGAAYVLGRLAYNLGRVVTYCGLGLIFGVVGKSFWMAGVQRWASITLGLLLIFGLFLSRKLALSKPVVLLVQRLKLAMGGLLRRRSLVALGLLGLLNGLLPCGLVYVACAGAAATGGVVSGLEYMAVFGLGTVPVMFVISVSGKLMPTALRLRLVRVVPLSIILLAILLILRGMSLGIPYVSPDLSSQDPACCSH